MDDEETLIRYGKEIFDNLTQKKTPANLEEVEKTKWEAIKQIYNEFNNLVFEEKEKDDVEKGIIEKAEEYKRKFHR